MRVAYSDESGVGDSREPITVVTAIVINVDRAWRSIEKKLKEIYFNTSNNLLEEKKGGHVLKGRLLYRELFKNTPGAEKALRETLVIPVEDGISIFYGAVDRDGFNGSQQTEKIPGISDTTTYDVAFDQCLRKVDKVVRSFTNESVLWVAERSDPQREPSSRMLHRLHNLTGEQEIDWDPTRDNPVSIVDTVYFGDPTESIALQLADVCCTTVTRYLLEKHYGWRRLATPFYELIENNVTDATPPILLKGD